MAIVHKGEEWALINRQNIELSQYGNNPEELLAIRMHFASADLGKYSYPKDVRMESDLPFVISEHIRSLGKLLLYDIEDKTEMDTISEKYIYDRIIARTNQTYFIFKNKKVGLIDSIGNVFIPPVYYNFAVYYLLPNDDFNFHKYFMKVILNKKEGYVSLKGIEYFD